MKNRLLIKLIILALFLSQLITSNSALGSNSPQLKDQIVIYNFEITATSDNERANVLLKGVYQSLGKLKEEDSIHKLKENDLRISLISENGKVIQSYDIENPLVQNLEFSEDQNGKLNQVNLENKKSSFSIRSKKIDDVSSIVVKKIGKGNKEDKLVEISLSSVSQQSADTISITENNLTHKGAAETPFEVIPIVNNGAISEKINLVIMGDGYTSGEMDKFVTDAQTVGNYIMTQSPYKERDSDFNVYAIKVISNASGAGADRNNLIDNYFGSCFYYDGFAARLLAPTKSLEVDNVLSTHFPLYDAGLIIVNSAVYGGSGGTYPTSSMHSSAPEIMLHEMGHKWGLHDEYWWIGNENAPNCTSNNNPEEIKWKSFLGVNGVGIFEYESPGTGWFRPHQNCKMRFLHEEFCEVCKDAQNKKFNDLLKIKTPVASFYNKKRFKGSETQLHEGSYTLEDLVKKGIADNSISSIKVTSGYKITLYDLNNFSGSSIDILNKNRRLAKVKFNNMTSSLIISKIY